VEGLVSLARDRGCADDPIIRRKIASSYELAASLRALGYKGFASFAQGSSAPEHSYMKMAMSEASKAAFELAMEIAGTVAPLTDPVLASQTRRFVDGFFLSFANTIARASSEIQRNIIAERVLGLPRASAAVDFSLTGHQDLLQQTAHKLLERECPPSLVRAHIDDPSAYEPLWRHLSEYTALGIGPAADLCLF